MLRKLSNSSQEVNLPQQGLNHATSAKCITTVPKFPIAFALQPTIVNVTAGLMVQSAFLHRRNGVGDLERLRVSIAVCRHTAENRTGTQAQMIFWLVAYLIASKIDSFIVPKG